MADLASFQAFVQTAVDWGNAALPLAKIAAALLCVLVCAVLGIVLVIGLVTLVVTAFVDASKTVRGE
jgi:hypothetical protein